MLRADVLEGPVCEIRNGTVWVGLAKAHFQDGRKFGVFAVFRHSSAHAHSAVGYRSAWKLPASHGVHSALPARAAMLPNEHGTGATLPVVQLQPAGHSMRRSAAATWTRTMCVSCA